MAAVTVHLVPPSMSTECGRAGLPNRRPQRDTCIGVRTIMSLGSVLATPHFDQHWSSSSSPAPFEGLNCVHLPASTAYDYIEHTHEVSRVNGAANALSIGPSAGYTLFLVFVHILLLFTAYVSSDTHIEREMCPWAISKYFGDWVPTQVLKCESIPMDGQSANQE
jgi:hypothetical protein